MSCMDGAVTRADFAVMIIPLRWMLDLNVAQAVTVYCRMLCDPVRI